MLSIYREWCVALPGTQSNLIPKPGINHECTTSYEFVTIVIFTCAGRTNVLFVLSNLLLKVIGNNSPLFLLFRTQKYRSNAGVVSGTSELGFATIFGSGRTTKLSIFSKIVEFNNTRAASNFGTLSFLV